MTSRNLFFKLAKEDAKRRIWLAALSFLVFFFAFPIAMAVSLSGEKEQLMQALQYGNSPVISEREALLEAALRIISPYENPFTVLIVIAAATVCGVSSFAYLHSKRKVDFYHSIPVKRQMLFSVNFTSGILIPAVMYALCLGIAQLVAVFYGVPASALIGLSVKGWLLHMLYFVLIYSAVALAMILTGNTIVGILGSGVFFFGFPWLSFIIQGYFENWFVTYYGFSESVTEKIMRISPIVSYILAVRMPESWRFEESLTFLELIVASIAASAALILLCTVLYKKRPSEAAGKAMAFTASKPVIRIFLTLLFGLSGGLFFWLLRPSTSWAVFGVLAGTVLCHCIVEIIYSFDFRRLFANKIQMAVCGAIGLMVLFCFKNDWLGYDTYLPKQEKVAQAAIDFGRDGWLRYAEIEDLGEGQEPVLRQRYTTDYVFENMKMTNTKPILEIAKKGIEYGQMRKVSEERYDAMEEEEEYWSYVTIQYTLTNGKKIERRYRLPLSEVWEEAGQVYLDEAYQMGKYPILSSSPEEIVRVQYRMQSNGTVLEEKQIMEADLCKDIVKLYQQELKTLSLDDRQTESPIGELRFLNQKEKEIFEYGRENRRSDLVWWDDYAGYYPIYPSFTKTLALLERAGIKLKFVWDNADDIKITAVQTLDNNSDKEMGWQVYEDKEEVEQILDALVLEEYYELNSFLKIDPDIRAEVSVDFGDGLAVISGFFHEGKVPPVVKEELDEKAEKLKQEAP